MPIEFVEQEKKKVIEKVEFFQTTKTRPLQLDGEVIPELINKVGDVKSGRISVPMVEQYLDKHVLVFDRELLGKLFEEADFRQEGSLDSRALVAALSGRYPKREYTKAWRDLVALLLNVPQLVLAEDFKSPKVAVNGVFNADSMWDNPPPDLPPIGKPRVKSAEATGELRTTASTAAMQASTSGSTGLGATGGSMPSSGGGTMRTVHGIKTAVPISAETTINRDLQGEVPRSTFQGTADFSRFSKGLELLPKLGVDTASSTQRDWRVASTSGGPVVLGAPKASIRAYAAQLPPTAIGLNTASLTMLRNSVRSTVTHKQDFSTTHRTLSPSELDLKKTMGQPMDVSKSMARVEPVRPTTMKFNADYVSWSDTSNCPTGPTRWYNEHSSVPAQAQEPSKYPWGKWE